MVRPELMIFEPYSGGHRSEYVCHLLRAWRDLRCSGRVIIATPAGLLQEQPGLSAGLLDGSWAEELSFGDLSKEGSPGLFALGCRNARLLRTLILQHKPRRVLAMYFDHLQLGMALGLRFDFDVRISGILFRPTIHYSDSRVLSRGWFRARQKRLFLRLAAANRHMGTLFSLDETAVPGLRRVGFHRTIALPDPVATPSEGLGFSDIRALYQIEAGRRVWTLFGVIDLRKGVRQVLEALSHMEAAEVSQICLVLIGLQSGAVKEGLSGWSAAAVGKGLQLVVDDRRVSSKEVQDTFAASDLILAPYQNHVGSSGILMRAAAAGRPVLSQSYGLMGFNVNTYKLGLVADTQNPKALLVAMRRFLAEPRAGFNPIDAQGFASANTPAAFAAVLLGNMGILKP